MNVNLFHQHYFDGNPERQKELDFCLEINKNLKVEGINFNYYSLSDRCTFNQIFELSKNYPNDINIHGNSDIYFEENSIKEIYRLYSQHKNKEKLVLALAPWDIFENNRVQLRYRSDSQDTWVFYGEIPKMPGADFFTGGILGCENRMAAIFTDSGYNVKNPAFSIKTFHYHLSNIRHYAPHDRIHGKYYCPNITSIEDVLNS